MHSLTVQSGDFGAIDVDMSMTFIWEGSTTASFVRFEREVLGS